MAIRVKSIGYVIHAQRQFRWQVAHGDAMGFEEINGGTQLLIAAYLNTKGLAGRV